MEVSMEPSAITDQNYYKFSKKYEELKVKKAELQHKIAIAKINKQINGLCILKQRHDNVAENIGTACKIMAGNSDKISEVIRNNEEHLNLPFECHKLMKDLISNEVFTSDFSNVTTDFNLDLATALEKTNNLNKKIALIEATVEESNQFHQKLLDIKGAKTKISGGCTHSPRKRRSELSESTFLSTFQANNMSTSSPTPNNSNL